MFGQCTVGSQLSLLNPRRPSQRMQCYDGAKSASTKAPNRVLQERGVTVAGSRGARGAAEVYPLRWLDGADAAESWRCGQWLGKLAKIYYCIELERDHNAIECRRRVPVLCMS